MISNFLCEKVALERKQDLTAGDVLFKGFFYCIGKLNQSCVKVKFSARYIGLTFSNIYVIVARGNQFVSITNNRES